MSGAVLLWIRPVAGQARRNGLQGIMHSCGSVHTLIDRLIIAGIQCLRPVQAKASGTDANALVRVIVP